jgi:archaellum component FlaF (FlaF/FlaG flagellin family)
MKVKRFSYSAIVAALLIGALVATLVVYSNTKESNKTVTEETVYLEREHPRNDDRPPNDFPEMGNGGRVE